MYRVAKMEFHYENIIGTEAAGAVHMAFDYDVLDDQAPDAQSMSQYTTYVRTGLWKSAKLTVDPRLANRVPWRYTAAHGYPNPSDRKTYDVGLLWVLGVGTAPAVTCGEIYVDYEIEFCSPTVEVVSLNTIMYSTTPSNTTTVYEQANTPVIVQNQGQQLLEYVGRNNVNIETMSGPQTKYVDIWKSLHDFVGEIIAEGGAGVSAAARAKFSSDFFQEGDTPTGNFYKFKDESGIDSMWRSPMVDHGSSASDLVAGQLAVGALKLLKNKFYAFPWHNQSTGLVTGWSAPADIPAELRYYISERLPHLGYSALALASKLRLRPRSALPKAIPSPDVTTSSTDVLPSAPTQLVGEEAEEEFVAVRKRRNDRL